jgi:hypothetical protein
MNAATQAFAASIVEMPARPELTKRHEFDSYGTNRERQAAFLLSSGAVRSGLNPTLFSDALFWPPQT